MINSIEPTNHAHNSSDGQNEFEDLLKRPNTLCSLNQQSRKGAPPPNSPIARSFARFLSSASDLIAAERDLAGYSGQDPAVDAWIRDAERAFSRTSAVLDELLALPAESAVATRLQRVGSLFRFVMLSNDPVAVAGVRNAAVAGLSRYHSHAGSGFEWRTARMVMTGLRQLETYLAIDDGLLAEEPMPGADFVADDASVPAAA